MAYVTEGNALNQPLRELSHSERRGIRLAVLNPAILRTTVIESLGLTAFCAKLIL